jgi:hypothetical protein
MDKSIIIIIIIILVSVCSCSFLVTTGGFSTWYFWDDLFGDDAPDGSDETTPDGSDGSDETTLDGSDGSDETTGTISGECQEGICEMPLVSPNGIHEFRLQKDGNLILANLETGEYKPTNIYPGEDSGPYTLILQEDGHLLEYNGLYELKGPDGLVWRSGKFPGTSGSPYKLNVEDSGSVIISNNTGKIIWKLNYD